MAITKYAALDAQILDIKGARRQSKTASLSTIAHFEDYRTNDGYMYVRLRAISSRINANHDGWPTAELAGDPSLLSHHQSSEGFTIEASAGNPNFGFPTFMHKPVFVDHNNGDPKRTRGVVADSKFRVIGPKEAALDPYWASKDVDPEHLPAAEVELLLEIDAHSFPKLAQAILSGDLDGFSMGADVERSKCSHCGNVATSPEEYCPHVLMKGAMHDVKTASGERVSKRSYENCYGIHFFEISAVFNPADPTALRRDVVATNKEAVHPLNDDDYLQIEQRTPGDMSDGTDFVQDDQDTPTLGPTLRGPVDHTGEGSEFIPLNWTHDPRSLPHNLGPIHQGAHNEPFGQLTPEQQQVIRDIRPGTDGAWINMHNQRDVGKYHPGGPIPGEDEYLDPTAEGQAINFADGEIMSPFLTVRPDQLPDELGPKHFGSVKTAENPLPQSMLVHAPDEVDTLRDERICPICGSTMEGETCDVCGYVEPPKGFDNPDLSQADKIREQMKNLEQAEAEPNGSVGEEQPDGQSAPTKMQGPQAMQNAGPLSSQMATKASSTNQVTDRMSWQTFVSEKTAARINKVEKPVYPAQTVVSNEPASQVVKSDQTRPVTAAMLTAKRLMATAQRNHTGESMSTRVADATSPGDTAPTTRVDVTGVGGFDQSSNDAASKAEAQVDVQGVGSTGTQNVEPYKTETLQTASPSSDDSGFNKDKTTEDSGPTSTFGDSDGTEKGVTEPVTHDAFPASEDGVKKAAQALAAAEAAYVAAKLAYDDKTLEQNEQQGNSPVAQGGSAVKGVKPVAEQFGERVNLLEHQTSPSNNSGPTSTWSGTDGNGVTKQVDPVDNHKQEWGGVPVPDVKLHTGAVRISTIRLADLEVELGISNRDDYYNRLAHIETLPEASIQAQIESYSKVKTAGLAKAEELRRTAGVTKVPRLFGQQTSAPNGFERIASDVAPIEPQNVNDAILDSAIFGR